MQILEGGDLVGTNRPGDRHFGVQVELKHWMASFSGQVFRYHCAPNLQQRILAAK
jgi:hypothetical protein